NSYSAAARIIWVYLLHSTASCLTIKDRSVKHSTDNLVLAANAPVDLQTHTTNSDGQWQPETLIRHFASEGFGLAAVTDHDRVDTVEALQQLAHQHQMPILVAAEFS